MRIRFPEVIGNHYGGKQNHQGIHRPGKSVAEDE